MIRSFPTSRVLGETLPPRWRTEGLSALTQALRGEALGRPASGSGLNSKHTNAQCVVFKRDPTSALLGSLSRRTGEGDPAAAGPGEGLWESGERAGVRADHLLARSSAAKVAVLQNRRRRASARRLGRCIRRSSVAPGARASARFRDRIRTGVGTFPPAALCGRLTRLRRFGFRAMPQGFESLLCKTVRPAGSCFDAVSRDEEGSHRLHKCALCPCKRRIREVGLSGVNAALRHRQPPAAPRLGSAFTICFTGACKGVKGPVINLKKTPPFRGVCEWRCARSAATPTLRRRRRLPLVSQGTAEASDMMREDNNRKPRKEVSHECQTSQPASVRFPGAPGPVPRSACSSDLVCAGP
jgi:hypothetical protein